MKKVMFAVGGTGGHLFPAQTVAKELKERGVDVFFAGAMLDENRFFDKTAFRYCQVTSATPFRSNPFQAATRLLKGLKMSLALLAREKPDLVVGFGSYHAFPLLCAAKLKKIPLVLFEADTFPGQVNRLFSRCALFSGIAFPQASSHLRGETRRVQMPCSHRAVFGILTVQQARELLGLDPNLFTLLVYGGSQGAAAINRQIVPLVQHAHAAGFSLQLIHLTGNSEVAEDVQKRCTAMGVRCYAKAFEAQMGTLWRAASLLIGRSGASTLSEMIAFQVPGILIPFPFAAKDHQKKNARYLQEEVKGGYTLLEEEVTIERLFHLLCSCTTQIECLKEQMRMNTASYPPFSELIYATLQS
jgi:UDP-N-acetylglucosamine--N-acetylmuramyl-(pentapeptide) pyrophosphoryl-undecaprenol N-acetylglucosamine transferase